MIFFPGGYTTLDMLELFEVLGQLGLNIPSHTKLYGVLIFAKLLKHVETHSCCFNPPFWLG